MDHILDYRTVVLTTGLISACLSAIMFNVAFRRKVYPGFFEWTAAFLIGALGLTAVGLQAILPHFLAFIVGNVLIVVTFLLISRGLIRFAEGAQKTWLDVSVLAAFTILFVFFYFFSQAVYPRIVLISIFISLTCLRCAVISIKKAPLVLGAQNGLLTATFLALSVLFAFRAASALAIPGYISSLFETGGLQVTGILGASVFITFLAMNLIIINAQRFEYDLRRSEKRYRRLIEDIQDDYYIFSHTPEGVFTYLSPSAGELFGVPTEEVIGRNWREVFRTTSEMAASVDRVDAECRAGRYPPPFEFSFEHPHDGEFTFEAQKRPVSGSTGNVIAIEGIARNLTERKRVERSLMESEEKYRHVVENVGVGILTVRGEKLVFVNNKVEDVLGVSRDELLQATDPFSFLHPEDRDQVVKRHIARLQGRELTPSNEFRVITPDGSQIWVESTNVRIDLQGKPALLHFLTDITERKKLEAEREGLIDKLQSALGEVKALSGLLPICSVCKKIRDDSGYWKQVEFYIQEHSRAQFSHSICPDCIKELYPEVAEKVLNPETPEG